VRPLCDHLEPLAAALANRPDRMRWGECLSTIVEWILPQRRLFDLADKVFHEALDAVFAGEATPLADRVRLAGSVGVIAGVLGGPAGKVFWHVPAEALKPLLMRVIHGA
jgi:hypothetical protein